MVNSVLEFESSKSLIARRYHAVKWTHAGCFTR
ncbi:hypothetical protein L585_19750 [Pantoea ananatis BRT175]|nr:hypothetical protein L585_19750 [Pantoea ananatis BRT175]